MVDTKHTEGMAALARARFTERSLATALRTGTTQYVVLGEELGDFALRERELKAQSRSFQVDWSGNWNEQLLAQGFSPRKKSLFTWLGCSWDGTEASLRRVLSEVASLAAEGSSLIFDCSNAGVYDVFSLSSLLEAYGFLLMEYLTPEEIRLLILNDSPTIAHTCFVNAVWKG